MDYDINITGSVPDSQVTIYSSNQKGEVVVYKELTEQQRTYLHKIIKWVRVQQSLDDFLQDDTQLAVYCPINNASFGFNMNIIEEVFTRNCYTKEEREYLNSLKSYFEVNGFKNKSTRTRYK